jgi:hypothetical protein
VEDAPGTKAVYPGRVSIPPQEVEVCETGENIRFNRKRRILLRRLRNLKSQA